MQIDHTELHVTHVAIELAKARESRALIRIAREEIEAGWKYAFIEALEAEWIVLAVIDEANRPDGFAIVRAGDITGAAIAPDMHEFIKKYWKLAGLTHGHVPEMDFNSVEHILNSISKIECLVVHVGSGVDNVCYVGTPTSVSQNAIELHLIRPNGEWEDNIRISAEDINMISFGGAYESGLMLVAKHKGGM
jgi:hypothetical protein